MTTSGAATLDIGEVVRRGENPVEIQLAAEKARREKRRPPELPPLPPLPADLPDPDRPK